jgi:hypothetical protein
MKHIRSTASLIILSASFVGCTAAPDRILLKEYAGNNYCHMKIETAGDPTMPTEREVIDFYGPCEKDLGVEISAWHKRNERSRRPDEPLERRDSRLKFQHAH